MLSLIHLELGSSLFQAKDNTSFHELVAVYLADPKVLYQYKTNPSVLDALKEEAALMPFEEAAEIVNFFTKASFKFMKISQPKLYQKMLELGQIEE